jgi:isochorismate hydrolase
MNFSMITDEVLVSLQGMPDLQSAVVVGIEAHVCVQQTVLDLLAEGYEVHLAVDAVSSQKSVDAQTAIERMRHAGCFVTTVDSILFEWMRTARHERFRDISKIVKGS